MQRPELHLCCWQTYFFLQQQKALVERISQCQISPSDLKFLINQYILEKRHAE